MAKKRNNSGTRDSTADMSDLSRVYRADKDEQPPARLDAAILAEARNAVGGRRMQGPFGSSRWTVPLSAAAVVVLSIGVVTLMVRETPVQQQLMSETAPVEIYSQTQEDAQKRSDTAPRSPAPSAPAPVPESPSVADAPQVKKKSPDDMATAPSAARERAANADESIAGAAGSRNERRLLAKQEAVRIVELQVGNRVIRTELAASRAELERGLMHRDRLAPDAGMLFLFPPRETDVCMWMKNTRIPLSAAFLDSNGVVLKIADMQPLNETAHCAQGVRYVLELNQGTFAAAGVKAGARIGGLPPPLD